MSFLRSGYDQPRSFSMLPFGRLYDMVFGVFDRGGCFPPARGSTIQTQSTQALESRGDEQRANTALEKQARSDPSTRIEPSPPLPEPGVSDVGTRPLEMRSRAESIGKTTALDLDLASADRVESTSPVVKAGPTLPPPPTATPSLSGAGPTETRAQKLQGRGLVLKPQMDVIQGFLPDPILDSLLKSAKSNWPKGGATTDTQFEAIEADFLILEARVKADQHIIGVMQKNVLMKPLKGTGKLMDVDAIKKAISRKNADEDRCWPEARATWKAFLREYEVFDRDLNRLTSRLTALAVELDKPAKGEEMTYAGTMTAGEYDAQELNKIKEIVAAGPTAKWGGRIGSAFTGNPPAEVDHYTIPSSNKTIFFRWAGGVLELHGVGKHIGTGNTEYEVSAWSNGKKFKIDLNKAKPVIK